MTDNEIVKALRRCGYHTECCYCNSVDECGSKRALGDNCLDLINRKDAEIERLKEAYLVYEETTGLKQAKSEAYKEFAERLKEEITKTLWRVITDLKYEGNKLFLRGLIFKNIDNTYKELTEGGNEDG